MAAGLAVSPDDSVAEVRMLLLDDWRHRTYFIDYFDGRLTPCVAEAARGAEHLRIGSSV